MCKRGETFIAVIHVDVQADDCEGSSSWTQDPREKMAVRFWLPSAESEMPASSCSLVMVTVNVCGEHGRCQVTRKVMPKCQAYSQQELEVRHQT